MSLRAFVVPLWQGAGDRAVARGAGTVADAIDVDWTELGAPACEDSGDDPRWVRHGDEVGGYLAAVADLVDAVTPGPMLAVGGDRTIEIPFVAEALREHDDDLVVVWCDAVAALHTPETSPSALAAGMALRVLLGDGDERLTSVTGPRLDPSRVVLVGTRAFDPAELEYVRTHAITCLGGDGRIDSLGQAVAATGARHAYVHVDLDVIDPGMGVPTSTTVDGGLTTLELAAGLASALRDVEVVGVGITGCNAFTPGELHGALPLLADLRALLAPRAGAAR